MSRRLRVPVSFCMVVVFRLYVLIDWMLVFFQQQNDRSLISEGHERDLGTANSRHRATDPFKPARASDPRDCAQSASTGLTLGCCGRKAPPKSSAIHPNDCAALARVAARRAIAQSAERNSLRIARRRRNRNFERRRLRISRIAAAASPNHRYGSRRGWPGNPRRRAQGSAVHEPALGVL